MGWVDFGHVFCDDPVEARRFARRECKWWLRNVFAPLLGGVTKAERLVRVDEVVVVRVDDIGLPDDARQALLRGKKVSLTMSWLQEVVPMLMRAPRDELVDGVRVFEK